MTENCTTTHRGNVDDEIYDEYLERIRERFSKLTNPLFRTDVDPEQLWQAYLSGFPESDRQYYNCNTCKSFIQKYGGLVTIDEDGEVSPVFWMTSEAPPTYSESVGKMWEMVNRARVNGVFLSDERDWGKAITGNWTHFSVIPHSTMLNRHSLMTADQVMASKRENFKQVVNAIHDVPKATLDNALAIVESDTLPNSNAIKGPALFLSKVYGMNRNQIWREISTAPDGFCHPRSSMFWTLIEDIMSRHYTLEQIARRFADKMDPTAYQRPKAEPTIGNIEAAEKIVEKLDIASSLRRRFARFEDIQAMWASTPGEPEEYKTKLGGVFDHLKKNKAPTVDLSQLPIKKISFEKFQAEVLSSAESVEIFTETKRQSFVALVTAADPTAKPILQWDNPVSWYVYSNGSLPHQWALTGDQWHNLTAITLKPDMWSGSRVSNYRNKGVIFVIDGCRDTRNTSLALFPSILRAELREIRSTIEMFSKSYKMEGAEDASACGILFTEDTDESVILRVNKTQRYKIHSWS